jgi:hypothetical protein
VLLTDDQYQKLQERFGNKLPHWIKILDEGIEQNGYKYKNHYLAIIKWSERDNGGQNAKAGNCNSGGPKAKPGKYDGIGVTIGTDTP